MSPLPVTVGQVLPPGCVAKTVTLTPLAGGTPISIKVKCAAAIADGTFPTVFNNDGPDGSFGVTSPIYLDNITTDGKQIGSLAVPTDMIVTSYSSKSELALNLSDDGKSITFVGYRGGPGFITGPNQLDVSNSNTPGVIDPRIRSPRSITAPLPKWMPTAIFKSTEEMPTVETTVAQARRQTRCITSLEMTTTAAFRHRNSWQLKWASIYLVHQHRTSGSRPGAACAAGHKQNRRL